MQADWPCSIGEQTEMEPGELQYPWLLFCAVPALASKLERMDSCILAQTSLSYLELDLIELEDLRPAADSSDCGTTELRKKL